MKIKYNGHNYDTDIWFGIKTRLSKWFGNYRWPVTIWIQHADDCCDYWTPVDSPEGRALLIDDDELHLHRLDFGELTKKPTSKTNKERTK